METKTYDLWGKPVVLEKQNISLDILNEYDLSNKKHINTLTNLLNLLYVALSKSDFFQSNILSNVAPIDNLAHEKLNNILAIDFINNFNKKSSAEFEKLKDAISRLYGILLESKYFYRGDHHIHTSKEYYELVLNQFENSNSRLNNFHIASKRFDSFLHNYLNIYRDTNSYLESQGGLKGYFPQKAFEHWISSEYLNWRATDKVLDFACWISPAVDVLRNYQPAVFYRHDITFKTDLKKKTISGFSNSIDSPSNYFDYIMAHCAIDNFEGTADTELFFEAYRILKPGGKILITPLHMSAKYENLISIGSPGLQIDEDANVVMGENTLRFGRLYDIEALNKRIININCGLDFSVIHILGLPLKIYPSTATNRFMLIGEKPL